VRAFRRVHYGAVNPLSYGAPIKVKWIDCLKLNRFYRYAGAPNNIAQDRTTAFD